MHALTVLAHCQGYSALTYTMAPAERSSHGNMNGLARCCHKVHMILAAGWYLRAAGVHPRAQSWQLPSSRTPQRCEPALRGAAAGALPFAPVQPGTRCRSAVRTLLLWW